jgi:tRNA pseudouridine55 synthase
VTGLLLVDKPEGITSAGVIRLLKPRLGRAKVGHLGTLDPFASGLLPLCLGEATKVARYLLLEEKSYTGTIQLGTATDTLDRTGAVTATALVSPVSSDRLQQVATEFRGQQTQVPPMYSALKRDGVPLYRLARRGIEVERAPREICVHSLDLRAAGDGRIDFAMRCTKGTYVRVLATDIAEALGTVGHLTVLRRTAVGSFRVEDAHGVDALRDGEGPLPLLGVRESLMGLRTFAVTTSTLQALGRGQQQGLLALPRPERVDEPALLVDADGAVGAIIEAHGDQQWHLARVLHPD